MSRPKALAVASCRKLFLNRRKNQDLCIKAVLPFGWSKDSLTLKPESNDVAYFNKIQAFVFRSEY